MEAPRLLETGRPSCRHGPAGAAGSCGGGRRHVAPGRAPRPRGARSRSSEASTRRTRVAMVTVGRTAPRAVRRGRPRPRATRASSSGMVSRRIAQTLCTASSAHPRLLPLLHGGNRVPAVLRPPTVGPPRSGCSRCSRPSGDGKGRPVFIADSGRPEPIAATRQCRRRGAAAGRHGGRAGRRDRYAARPSARIASPVSNAASRSPPSRNAPAASMLREPVHERGQHPGDLERAVGAGEGPSATPSTGAAARSRGMRTQRYAGAEVGEQERGRARVRRRERAVAAAERREPGARRGGGGRRRRPLGGPAPSAIAVASTSSADERGPVADVLVERRRLHADPVGDGGHRDGVEPARLEERQPPPRRSGRGSSGPAWGSSSAKALSRPIRPRCGVVERRRVLEAVARRAGPCPRGRRGRCRRAAAAWHRAPSPPRGPRAPSPTGGTGCRSGPRPAGWRGSRPSTRSTASTSGISSTGWPPSARYAATARANAARPSRRSQVRGVPLTKAGVGCSGRRARWRASNWQSCGRSGCADGVMATIHSYDGYGQ